MYYVECLSNLPPSLGSQITTPFLNSIVKLISEKGLNVANNIKYIYYSFSITKLQKSKEKCSKLKILYK